MDEVNCVGPFYVAVALGEPPDFVGIGSLPNGGPVAALAEFSVVVGNFAGVGIDRVPVEREVLV